MTCIPPFCPNPRCACHRARQGRGRWWIKRGWHPSAHSGPVQRYRCRACGRTFSERSFSVHFATRHRVDLRRVAHAICSGCGVRSIARELGFSEKVILNRLARLGRQAIGMHAQLRGHLCLAEPFVADGFESFIGSQDWPNNFTLLLGAQSQYLYSLDYAQLRRKGRMSAAQQRRREVLLRRVPIARGQIERSFARILSELGRLWSEGGGQRALTLVTDRHHSYRRAIGAERALTSAAAAGRFLHRRIDSKRPRTRTNPLFSANYFDREIRKDQASHVRQTVCWGRDVNNAMDRMWLYGVWHNCWKARRIGGGDRRTHAEHAQVSAAALEELRGRFFTRRFFFTHLSLSVSQWRSWLRGWPTPGKPFVPRLRAYTLD